MVRLNFLLFHRLPTTRLQTDQSETFTTSFAPSIADSKYIDERISLKMKRKDALSSVSYNLCLAALRVSLEIGRGMPVNFSSSLKNTPKPE
mmetsp:Transcript_12113/g.19546  ORF Transcript_12113/g.19546 Transcript_12113/m.19546 type:complete len:91 (+) Transcript_12113:131-403(+)